MCQNLNFGSELSKSTPEVAFLEMMLQRSTEVQQERDKKHKIELMKERDKNKGLAAKLRKLEFYKLKQKIEKANPKSDAMDPKVVK